MKNGILYTAIIITMAGCNTPKNSGGAKEAYDYSQAQIPYEEFTPAGHTQAILLGGFGSDMCYDSKSEIFYMLTDRGPNTDGPTPESKVFPMKDYSPTVGKFKMVDGELQLIEKIVLRDATGIPYTPFPNSVGNGVEGEVAYDLDGNIITSAQRGLDTEGLALCSDGTFWVSDEYGPFVMHFDATGGLIEEFYPSKGLPAYFGQLRPNSGMEGLTISADNQKLYGVMQKPLYLPDSRTKNESVNNRLIEIDLNSGQTREFIYQMETPKNVVSGLEWVSDGKLLVLERDTDLPNGGSGFKRVYEVDLAKASDISGNTAVEMLDDDELQKENILCVTKSLFLDVMEAVPTYPHDKAEGIALLNGGRTLAVVNDDDFGVNDTPDGKYKIKEDASGNQDKGTIYFIELK